MKYPVKLIWTHVPADQMISRFKPVETWLVKHVGPRRKMWRTNSHISIDFDAWELTFYFMDPEHAMLFALMWG